MKIDVRHSLPCSTARFWSLDWDDGFDEMLRRHTSVRRELLAESVDGPVRIRRIRLTADRELPGPVAAALGSRTLTYEQENRFDATRGEMRWTVLPGPLGVRLKASGRFRAEDDGPEATVMRVDGEILVAIPLLGGTVERLVVAEIEKSYARLAETVREALAS
jgi:hypothetical protein